LRNRVVDWGTARDEIMPLSTAAQTYATDFWAACADDLNTPIALAHLWGMVKDGALHPAEKWALLREFDTVLALDIPGMGDTSIDPDLQGLIQQREVARQVKDWATSDALRATLLARGIIVKDTPDGPVWMTKG
jgi:cysteinyl-tRNA synthetase